MVNEILVGRKQSGTSETKRQHMDDFRESGSFNAKGNLAL